jgi:hypothetical protein
MSGFGEWRGYAVIEDFGRQVGLHIGRETALNEFHQVGQIDAQGVTASTVTHSDGVLPPVGMRIPMEVAEALYKALDRVFGHENQNGQVSALQEAIQVERKRVDNILGTLLTPQAFITQGKAR